MKVKEHLENIEDNTGLSRNLIYFIPLLALFRESVTIFRELYCMLIFIEKLVSLYYYTLMFHQSLFRKLLNYCYMLVFIKKY